jgi:crossover junction endodeoxyribonuclease RusA
MIHEAFMVLPWPPSVNSYWRHSARGTYIGKPGRQFRKDALAAIAKEQLKPFGDSRVSVVIELRAPDRRRRDIDNHLKGLLDVLTHSKIIDDDSQVDHLRIIRGPIEKDGAAYVTIEKL